MSAAYFLCLLTFVFGLCDAELTLSWEEWFIESVLANPMSKLFRVRPPSSDLAGEGFPTFGELDRDVDLVLPVLQRMKERTFFRIFKVDLTRSCPFWAADAMCSHPEGGCTVCACDQDQIPLSWKMRPIENFVVRGEVDQEAEQYEGFEDTGSDAGQTLWEQPEYFFRANPTKETNMVLHKSNSITNSGSPSAIWVDMMLNRPGYTAYKGAAVWNQIYNENCMGMLGSDKVHESLIVSEFDHDYQPTCREEHLFYRLLSGMHSNIAALSSEYFSVDPFELRSVEVGDEGGLLALKKLPNVDFFEEKLAGHTGRLENLYFTFAILMRTLCKLAPVMEEVTCHTGDAKKDLSSRTDLFFLLNQTYSSCDDRSSCDESLFGPKHSQVLRQFHNISRVLDCVECQKCRLHGKLKMTALQLALRASGTQTVQSLERNEVTALINALFYFADSIRILRRMEARITYRRAVLPTCYMLTAFVAVLLVFWLNRYLREAFPHAKVHPKDRITSETSEDDQSPSQEKLESPSPSTRDSTSSAPKRRR
eukprot:GHVN01005532.1.p1 GENE.GHVN01005532.1~~GHVN01005532.1.p1  ORF type:complete len:537 (+),score=49.07 GHVN01005532.1:947-2557(+)